MAILLLKDSPEWARIGGRLLLPVHDELIAEVPMEYAKKGGELLSSIMCEAANFLPFPSKCDVTTTLRWYGLEYPCQHPQPKSLDGMSEDEVKWVQYHLVEMEYNLPVILEEDGSKPRGDAAFGVNGKETAEMNECIQSYMHRYHITRDQFIEHIHNRVYYRK